MDGSSAEAVFLLAYLIGLLVVGNRSSRLFPFNF